MNKDLKTISNLDTAINALQVFCDNYCIRDIVEQDPIFNCSECPFADGDICLVHLFGKKYGYRISSMAR